MGLYNTDPRYHYVYGFGDKGLDVSVEYGVTIAYNDIKDVDAGFAPTEAERRPNPRLALRSQNWRYKLALISRKLARYFAKRCLSCVR